MLGWMPGGRFCLHPGAALPAPLITVVRRDMTTPKLIWWLLNSGLAAVLALLLVFAAWVGFNRWDSKTNRGYKVGYFGEFNQVSNALASIPGVTITQAWANLDLTLEEFGFTGTTASGGPIHLAFGELNRSISSCRS